MQAKAGQYKCLQKFVFKTKGFTFVSILFIATQNVRNMDLKPTLPFRQRATQAGTRISNSLQQHWLKMALLGAAAYMAHHKDMDIDLQLSQAPAAVVRSVKATTTAAAAQSAASYSAVAKPINTSLKEKPKAKASQEQRHRRLNVSNLANTYSNLTADDKGEPAAESKAARISKKAKQKAYVKRFAKVAQMEMEKYGIPASITLAQGLLESNVGESKLATRNNNHFGMKCFSRRCRKGHCSNFTDDSHKDFFRIYKSAWESYRAHSLLLKRSERYQPLFELRSTDYRSWARGLKKAGYATDPDYAQKLVNLIENLDLDRFDR